MRIATWNIERLKHKKSLNEILSACEQVQADILVLTESDERVCPNYRYCFHTPMPSDIKLPYYSEPLRYRPTEHRISIFTNYECIQQYTTYDKNTSLCVELKTEKGNLLVYGTIIGIFGNRESSFKQDLLNQVDDYKRLSADGRNLCICGDFNCSFADNYYFTQYGRNTLLQYFADNHMELLTKSIPCCIDHISVSKQYISGSEIMIEEWNKDKTLSDHKGIAVTFA